MGAGAPDYVDELLSAGAIERAGIFEAGPVVALASKCREQGAQGRLSNADNMAFLGVLSTQLVWERFVRRRPAPAPIDEDRIGTRVTETLA